MAPCRTTRRGGWSTTPTPTSWRRRRGCGTTPTRPSGTASSPCATRAATSCARPATPTEQQRDLGAAFERLAREATPSRRVPGGRGRGDHAAQELRRHRRVHRRGPAAGPSTCSASRASSSSTRSTTGASATGSTAATSSSPYGAARGPQPRHGRVLRGRPAAAADLLRAAGRPRAGRRRMADEAIAHGRGRAARRLGLPAGPLAQPRRARPGVGAGAGGRHPRRVPRRRHGRPHRPGVLPQRPARSRPTSTAARRTSARSTTWASPARRPRRWPR